MATLQAIKGRLCRRQGMTRRSGRRSMPAALLLSLSLLALVPVCAAPPPARDPFQPAQDAQAGHAGPRAANGPANRVKGKVGAGDRWHYWTVDGQGRWRRCEPPRPAANQDHEDHNDVTG